MTLLTDEDYSNLERMQLKFEEDEAKHLLVFIDFKLNAGLYQVDQCNVLVVIPPNYPAAGNDMFWTYPRLQRTDGLVIPGTIDSTLSDCQRDIRIFEGKTYDRWSRHWEKDNQKWRAGKDNIETIVNRLTYVLANSHEK